MRLKVEKIRLSNHLTVLLFPKQSTEVTFLRAGVRAGSVFEDPSLAGIAHFLEHMAFKGTEKYPTSREINYEIEKLGGYNNAYTNKFLASYYLHVPYEHIEKGMDILYEMVCKPLFPEQEIEKERQVILEELQQSKNDPESWVWKIYREAVWGEKDPLGRPVLGKEESLQKIQRENLLSFWKELYTPQNSVLVIGGKMEKKEILALVRKYFGKWQKRGKRKYYRVPEKLYLKSRWETREKSVQVNLILAWAFSSSRNIPKKQQVLQRVFSSCLGVGGSSPIFINLREKRSLCYSVFAFSEVYFKSYSLGVCGSFRKERGALKEIIEGVKESLVELTNKKKAREQLERVKNSSVTSMSLALEKTSYVTDTLLRHYLVEDEIWNPKENLELVKKITPEKIQRLAKKLLSSKPVIIGIAPFERPKNIHSWW